MDPVNQMGRDYFNETPLQSGFTTLPHFGYHFGSHHLWLVSR